MRRTVARAGRGLVPAVRACRPLLRCRRQSRTYSSLLHHSSAALLSSSAFSSSAFTSAAWSSSSIMLPVVSSYRLCNYSTQSQRGAEVEEGEQGGEEPVKGETRGGHDKDAASENGTVANNQKANESEPKPSSVTPTRRGRGARRCGNSRSSSSYMKTYHMTGAGEHTITQMKATTSRHVITTDVPRSMGGEDSAPQPVELLLASLCGCEQVTALYVGRMMKPRVRVDKIVFRVHATRDQRGALALPVPRRGTGFQDQEDDGGNSSAPLSRLQRIWGTAHVYTQTDTSQAQIDVLAAEVKERCPIANMVQLSGCELDIDFIQAEEDEDQEEKQP